MGFKSKSSRIRCLFAQGKAEAIQHRSSVWEIHSGTVLILCTKILLLSKCIKIYLEIDKVAFLEKKREWWSAGLVKHEAGLPLPEHLRVCVDLLPGEYTKWVKNIFSLSSMSLLTGSLMYDTRRGAQDRQMECELICIHQVQFSLPLIFAHKVQ